MIFYRVFLILVLSYMFANAKESIKFGLLYEKIFCTKEEAEIGTNLWLKQMKQEHANLDMDVLFYSDEKKILEDYKNRKVSAIIGNGFFYWENRKKIDKLSVDKWVLSRNSNKFEQFYVIKNVNSEFDFNNKHVRKVLYGEEIGRIWFETLVYKNSKDSKKILKNINRVGKDKKLIFDVFFNKDSVAVVGKDLYDSMLEVNPQIEQRIKILAKSKPIFIRGIGFTRKGIEKSIRDSLFKLTKRINESKTNYEVISFIQVQNIFLMTGDELNKLNKFYEEYDKLRNK